jgi:glycosyltransferase involved in cell wall biosynthesis
MISVVVPARNAAATIERTLAALALQRLDQAYEVIVVDSGSTDGTPDLVAAAAGVDRLLSNPSGEPASSRNLGAAHARGRLLAFTDADCEPEPGWLAAGITALDGADLVQGRVSAAGPAGPFARTVTVGAEHGLYETANLFVRREWFERVGGFEPVPGLDLGDGAPFGEDAWFAWRVKRAGASSFFASDAVVNHAVFARGPAAYVAETARRRHFPALVALIPELRGTFLHRRVFLSEVSLRFDLALAGTGLALAGRRARPLLLLAAPYAAELVRAARQAGRRGEPAAAVLWARLAADGLTCGALVSGSVRSRTPVL